MCRGNLLPITYDVVFDAISQCVAYMDREGIELKSLGLPEIEFKLLKNSLNLEPFTIATAYAPLVIFCQR